MRLISSVIVNLEGSLEAGSLSEVQGREEGFPGGGNCVLKCTTQS